jgi:hypothetical protein
MSIVGGFFRFLSAFMLALALLGGASFVAVQYLIAQYAAAPPKPTFPNDKANLAKAAVTKAPAAAAPAAAPSPKPSESPGYRAKVTLDIGLNIREVPESDSPRIGGVDYNEEIIILQDSDDKNWQKIRLPESNVEGWIKAGYTQRVATGAAGQ